MFKQSPRVLLRKTHPPLCTRGASIGCVSCHHPRIRYAAPAQGGFSFPWYTPPVSATRIHAPVVRFRTRVFLLGGICTKEPFHLYTNKTPRRSAGCFPIILYILATPLSRAAFATAAATAALTVLSSAEGMI